MNISHVLAIIRSISDLMCPNAVVTGQVPAAYAGMADCLPDSTPRPAWETWRLSTIRVN